MKKFLFLFSAVFCLGACSVDNQELDNSDLNLEELNVNLETVVCSVTSFDYGTSGKIEVRNDRDLLYVTITATGENTLSATSLHIAGSFAGFPTVGKGNLQPDRMEYQETFASGVKKHTFQFPLDVLSENLVIASYTTFTGGISAWAGDIAVKQGNWAYFSYKVNEHPVNAGPEPAEPATAKRSVVNTLPSWDEARKLFANQLAAGVDGRAGTYNPSIWELINFYNTLEEDEKLRDFSTTYTLGTGDCTDSVVLTVRVVAD